MISPALNPRVVAASDAGEVMAELSWAAGVGREEAASKADTLTIALENVPTSAALLMKNDMAALGGAVAADYQGPAAQADVRAMVLIGSRRHFAGLIESLAAASSECSAVADALRLTIVNYDRRHFTIEAGLKRIEMGPRPVLMGIVNVTPDSFSDGGKFFCVDRAVEHALKLADDGADILDIGGESTRPGSTPVHARQELERVIPVIDALNRRTGVPVSIDTRKSAVATEAFRAGAVMVNDISGLTADEEMAAVVGEAGAALVVMHMQGTPQTMQQAPQYEHLMSQVCRFLRQSICRAVRAGVDEEKIIVDPGIGFGKRLEHNLELLKRVGQLRSLGRPIMVGPSRKSFIGAIAGAPVEERSTGTAVSVAMSLARGALVFRVHDVKEMAEALAVAGAIAGAESTIKAGKEHVAADN
ncbi:MAG: dihydropteroate synthase [Planctomycetia bacterium]|nr:dihydropteroate synthase [Planctomycetia bacterium]